MKKSNHTRLLTQIKCVAVTILIVLLMLMIGGCNSASPSNNYTDTSSNKYFISVGSTSDGYTFYYDKYTMIMYAKDNYGVGGFGGGITVLYNADGTVMTLGDWNNLEPDIETEVSSDVKGR